jgi:hypothetical protein
MSLIQGLVTLANQITFLRITSEWNRSSGQVEVSASPSLFQSHEKTNVVVRDELYASVNDIITIKFTNHLQGMENVH